jgi:hypothetical protein
MEWHDYLLIMNFRNCGRKQLRVFENRVLRRIVQYFDRRGIKLQEVGENCKMRNFINCTLRQI